MLSATLPEVFVDAAEDMADHGFSFRCHQARGLSAVMFPVFDLSASIADRPEALGSKEKLWLTPEAKLGLGNDLHLFKVGRAGTGENWAEKGRLRDCKGARAALRRVPSRYM